MEGYSTAIVLADNMATAIERKLHTISVFVDLEKAFNIIDMLTIVWKYGLGHIQAMKFQFIYCRKKQ